MKLNTIESTMDSYLELAATEGKSVVGLILD